MIPGGEGTFFGIVNTNGCGVSDTFYNPSFPPRDKDNVVVIAKGLALGSFLKLVPETTIFLETFMTDGGISTVKSLNTTGMTLLEVELEEFNLLNLFVLCNLRNYLLPAGVDSFVE